MGTFKRVVSRLALGLVALVVAGALLEQVGAHLDASRYPSPGRRVDLGDGRAMYLDCRGEGSPTVLLEAGHHGWSASWSAVTPEVATWTRVCSYDRAGLGESDPDEAPRAAASVTRDLERLLERAHEPPPYVLVGHSAGGMYQRLFFAAHPEQVAGMVLVDTDEPTDEADRRDVAEAPDDARTAAILGLAVHTGLLRFVVQVLGVDPGGADAARYPEEARVRFRARMRALAGAMNGEWASYQSAYTTVTDLPLGDRPLVVLAALGYRSTPADRDDWRARQERLASLSTRGKLVVLEEEGHYLPLLRPDVVVGAIREVVEKR
jgi:pimeloyl-ACP methyl ester carboxylesterase